MIVRTYGRRKPYLARSCSDSSFNGGGGDSEEDTFMEPLSQESSQDVYNFNFSSQDSSSPWTFDPDMSSLPPRPLLPDSYSQGDGFDPKSKKVGNLSRKEPKNGKFKGGSSNLVVVRPPPATSTLMEAQEFGEMMEHVDEVNFALDGLRNGQPLRIRRASLLSLLSICATPTQRRLLRTQGMDKIILDAVLALPLDDSPSTLAAAALFYILASDGQDENLLDSPTCIRFLLRLLTPSAPNITEEKRQTLGCKLLALCREPSKLGDQSKKLDTSSTAIISKVQEILLSCKEIEESNRNDEGLGRPELSPKWIALLAMEKACLSTVSLEDTLGTVKKVGGNFKERLREFGGLDAVFDVAINCHSVMEGWSEHSLRSIRELKDDVALQTVVMLLKCLKIMENATFLSKDNQDHLLSMSGKLEVGSSLSFTALVISFIRIVSGLSLLQGSSIPSDRSSGYSASQSLLEVDHEVGGTSSSNSSRRCNTMEKEASLTESFRTSQKRLRSSTSQSVISVSSFSDNTTDGCSVKKEHNSTSGSCNGLSGSLKNGNVRSTCIPKMSLGLGKKPSVTGNTKNKNLEESQDPFAFDDDEFVPSKWDTLSTKKEVSHSRKSRETVREVENGCQPQLTMSKYKSNSGQDIHSCEITCSPPSNGENSVLLADCLLTAVKVLMNLTNDNPVGCKQIAAYGGLETLSTLIIGHFPSFSSMSQNSQTKETLLPLKSSAKLEYQNGRHLGDQELDFLVAILGLLVNLVEKDSRNRSRLAAASVSVPTSQRSEGMDSQRDVIPLLCSIFLANQGAGEAAGEGKPLPVDEEDALQQEESEAEKMIVEAYAALLLAFLSTESKDVREAIACCLPDNNLKILVPVLERFVEFHLTLNMISPETHLAVSEVIESCRGP